MTEVQKAQDALEQADRAGYRDHVAVAQVHATLAMAEVLERIYERLDRLGG